MAASIAFVDDSETLSQLESFVIQYHAVLSRYSLVAPAQLSERLSNATQLSVQPLLSAEKGAIAQISAQVAMGQMIAVICFSEFLASSCLAADYQTLQRLCQVHNVPFALNLATASMILEQLRRSQVAHLIFNPVSGQGNAVEELKLIEEILSPAMALHVVSTTAEDQIMDLVHNAIAAEADLVIASGGDGTVSAVAEALIGVDIPLGIIPRGTANAFASALGITGGFAQLRRACEIIIQNHTAKVDVARCNNRPMVLLAGIGFEAAVVENANREAKDRWGVLAYIMEGFRQFGNQELFTLELEIEGVIQTFQANAVTVANAAPSTSIMAQGGGFVDLKDGLLDITIAAPQSDLEAIGAMVNLVGAALMRSPTNRDDIINLQTQQVKITTIPPQKVVVDGEITGTTPIEVTCIPQGLTLFTPALS